MRLLLLLAAITGLHALERPGVEFKIYQFPANQIPTIDGKSNDWSQVPASYSIGMEQLKDTVHNSAINKKYLDVSVKVGWVPLQAL